MARDDASAPGPGRSTSKKAFEELTRQIAERNEQAHQAARKLRERGEAKKRAERRRRDLS